jgi:hypothetical protein
MLVIFIISFRELSRGNNDRRPDIDFTAAKLYLKASPTPILRAGGDHFDLKSIPGVSKNDAFSNSSKEEMSELYDISRGLLGYEDKRVWTKNAGKQDCYWARCFAQGNSVCSSSKSLRAHTTAKVGCKAAFVFCISPGTKKGLITFTQPHCAACLEQSPEFLKNNGTIFTQLSSPGKLDGLRQEASKMMNNDKGLSASSVSKQFVGKVLAISIMPTTLPVEDAGVVHRPPQAILSRLMRDARKSSITAGTMITSIRK